MVKARANLHRLGGAVNGPHWAKFWLSVLGVMEWEAVNPTPPELWYVQLREISSDLSFLGLIVGLEAFSGLGTNRPLAMVDTHPSSVFTNVIYSIQAFFISLEFTDPTAT